MRAKLTKTRDPECMIRNSCKVKKENNFFIYAIHAIIMLFVITGDEIKI